MGPGAGWEATKRRIYLVCLLVAAPVMPLLALLDDGLDTTMGLAYPTMGIVLATVAVGLWAGWLRNADAELIVLLAVPALWAARLVSLLYLDPDLAVAARAASDSVVPGLAVVVIVGYLAGDTRRGWRAAAGVTVGYALLVLPAVVGALLAGRAPPAATLLRGVLFLAVVGALVSLLARLREQAAGEAARSQALAELARTDPLTGLPNRRASTERARQLLAAATRHGRPMCVALADLDRFKELNDRRGHAAGDEALVATGETLVATLRAADAAGRWGGDELLVLLPEAGLADAVVALERARAAVAERLADDGVTLSIGVVELVAGEGSTTCWREPTAPCTRPRPGAATGSSPGSTRRGRTAGRSRPAGEGRSALQGTQRAMHAPWRHPTGSPRWPPGHAPSTGAT